MNGSKASIDEIIKFMNEKGVNPKTGLIMDYVAKNVHFRTFYRAMLCI